jgi:hypothetical protein
VLCVIGIKLQISGFDCIQGNSLHFGVNHIGKAEFALSVSRIHVSLELIVGDLISLLILAVAVTVLLDGIIGEVDD